MRIEESLIATTRLDRHGDVVTKECLEDMAQQLREGYRPLILEHDPRIPPLGRTIGGRIVATEGQASLIAISEVFEETDDFSAVGDREIILRDFDRDGFTLIHDRSYRDDPDKTDLQHLGSLPSVTLQEEGKKSFEPISVLLVGIGVVAANKFFGALLSKAGEDAWLAIKSGAKKLIQRKKEQGLDYLFILEIQKERGDSMLSIQTILTRPTAEELQDFLENGVSLLKDLLTQEDIPGDVRRMVLHYKAGKLYPGFALRKDCVSIQFALSPIEGIEPDEGNRN